MNKENILNESFFDRLKKFKASLPSFKEISGKMKVNMPGFKKNVSNLNKILSKMDKRNKELFGDDYPELPKYKPEDFIRK
tara:strand:+ start:113 stop:352 length:240 start_codon:yes stop_codon:yes gene_type:complete